MTDINEVEKINEQILDKVVKWHDGFRRHAWEVRTVQTL